MEDQRIKRTQDTARADRAVEDQARTTVDASLASVEERRRMFREFTTQVLPGVANPPGWRYTWLSTTNQYDPVHRRLRMGYELVKVTELPGMENFRVNSGAFEGCVQVNEMILAKLPEELYQDIMTEFHYNAPNAEEQRLKANTVLPDEDREGRQLGSAEGDGFSSLGGRPHRRPVFQ